MRALGADGSLTDIALDGLPPIFHQCAASGLMEVALDPAFARNAVVYLTTGYGEPASSGIQHVQVHRNIDRSFAGIHEQCSWARAKSTV